MIVIRMSRLGRLNRPIYSIVATNSRWSRDGKYLEKLGQYDPRSPKETIKSIDVEGIKKWMDQGALLSDTVRTILKKEKVEISL